ncbi:MAG TPA: hypothetical protein VJH20_05950 [Candidatus Nanoarchaeia archaeon]|nr:hypothetical protein [Candidatus Nanoarchaeia archaeon]
MEIKKFKPSLDDFISQELSHSTVILHPVYYIESYKFTKDRYQRYFRDPYSEVVYPYVLKLIEFFAPTPLEKRRILPRQELDSYLESRNSALKALATMIVYRRFLLKIPSASYLLKMIEHVNPNSLFDKIPTSQEISDICAEVAKFKASDEYKVMKEFNVPLLGTRDDKFLEIHQKVLSK